LRVGHDRRRVRVGEHDVVALGLQRFERLCAGVVELAGLADDDRPRADDQNLPKICPFHAFSNPSPIFSSCPGSSFGFFTFFGSMSSTTVEPMWNVPSSCPLASFGPRAPYSIVFFSRLPSLVTSDSSKATLISPTQVAPTMTTATRPNFSLSIQLTRRS